MFNLEANSLILDLVLGKTFIIIHCCSDLAIALRKRLGHWFRVVELLKMSPNTPESQVKQAYSNIGDYYIDRQNWLVKI